MTTLAQLSAHLHGTELRALVEAALVKVAGAEVRQSDLSPSRRAWASNMLSARGALDSERVMGIFLTNPTVLSALGDGATPSDSDIEYVVRQEVLPVIAPI